MSAALRVLVCHNRYQLRGGEDSVCESEVELLRQYGHDVQMFERSNAGIDTGSPKFAAAAEAIWSSDSARDFEKKLEEFRPHVVHVHNTFAKISPSIYWAASRAHVAVVQTLHNFRLLCPQAMFLRDGKVCEDCLGKLPWRGAVRGCYRGSVAQSTVLASMVTAHRMIGTWQSKVTRYIALNEFCRQKFIEGGLPADRIVIKPNFVDFEAPPTGAREGFLFVGRLSLEKGIDTLVSAAQQVGGLHLRVAGTGPEAHLLHGVAGVDALGALDGNAVRFEMSRSMALVLPSIWYENFPRTLVEAMACGLPIIASRIGALAELVDEGVSGLLFEAGNASDLASKLQWARENPEALRSMGIRARQIYEDKFTASRNYAQMMAIYEDAMEQAKKDGQR
ncbi:glycosyltransferase [Pelomonas sp. Root1444]|uniref:glycosyltransferase n=1 Tax=Pelomonas sp. Root1444 TaxID=1736464 RepID=UPI000702CCD8|nr:glycosyltransferase [Pelomonas sp. Root1444]KQY82887.1 transferase [Pelomonas sp. Root1444]